MTKRQQQIYDIICREVASQGYPPSVREIAAELGLKSPSTVQTHLNALEDKGLIRRDVSKSRALEIVGGNPYGFIDDVNSASEVHTAGRMVSLPLVGRVAAGTPLLADQNIESYITLPESLVGSDASFVLRVKGESMIRAGIMDGDYVIVKKTETAENGQIVVALLDDSATVKTFYKEKNCIRLQPENPFMEPIYTTNPLILGRVVALIRTI
ncbi:MAG: transcriptional repressor LexA [Coriobacteriales bacterium]|nr:transcriptional repressor LexA [Coriobacteriales bacterium]